MHYLTSPNTACQQLERFSNGHILDILIRNVIYPKHAAANAPTGILKYRVNSVQLDFMIYSRTERKASTSLEVVSHLAETHWHSPCVS